MSKVRVYELAKEFGVESKEVVKLLGEMGEYVKSASSTLEGPAVKKFRSRMSSPAGGDAGAGQQRSGAPGAAAGSRPGPTPGTAGPRRRRPPRPAPRARPSRPPGAPPRAPRPARPPRGRPPARRRAPRHPLPGPHRPLPGRPRPPSARLPVRPLRRPRAAPLRQDPPHPAERPPQGRARWARDRPRPARAPRRARHRGPGTTRSAPVAARCRGRRPRGRATTRSSTPAPCHRGPRAAACPAHPGPTPGCSSTGPVPRPAPADVRAVPAPARAVPVHGRAVRVGRASARVPAVPAAAPSGGHGLRPASRRRARRRLHRGPSAPAVAPAGRGPGGRGRGGAPGAFGKPGGKPSRGRKSKRAKRQEFDNMQAPTIGGVRISAGNGEVVRLPRGASLTDFADKIDANPADLVTVLFNLGEMVTATQSLDDDTLRLLGSELNYDVQVVSPEDEDRELLRVLRPGVRRGRGRRGPGSRARRSSRSWVTSTTARPSCSTRSAHTNVVAGEAGGITQHIGAYQVHKRVDGEDRAITFIDTPGHEAFTAMRARGAQVTDIAVLVVAADDGVKPQTIEALNHAQAADVPDRGGGQQGRQGGRRPDEGPRAAHRVRPGRRGVRRRHDVRRRLGQERHRHRRAARGGAAHRRRRPGPAGQPEQDAQGVAIEAHLDSGRGPVATVLVQRGTLRPGDSIVAGEAYGRVRAMLDEHGDPVRRPVRPVRCRCSASPRCPAPATPSWSSPRTAWPGRSPRRGRRASATPQLAKARPRRTLEDFLSQVGKGEVQNAQPHPQGRRVRCRSRRSRTRCSRSTWATR